MTGITVYTVLYFVAVVYAENQPSYDFIIVGGGTAGNVIATRLSENEKHSVLVLEAGPSELEYPDVAVPLKCGALQRTYVDWGFRTEPQKYAMFGLREQRAMWSQGKMLGGSSSHNYLVNIRGSRHDFDYWRDLGNEGWAYEDVLPYFIKSENNEDEILAKSDYHGTKGPWTITNDDAFQQLVDTIIDAAVEIGFNKTDVNGPNQEGFGPGQHSVKLGQRASSASAFLRPVMSRLNLKVVTWAYVTKVLIDPESKTAIGVTYSKNKNTYTVYANKEVIVSAGALMSPKILMLSGIGPTDHLDSLGIPVLADLPVGDGLEDHPATFLEYSVEEPVTITPAKLGNFQTVFDYYIYGKGPLTTSGIPVNGFEKTDHQPVNHKFPYIQYCTISLLPGTDKGMSDTLRDNFGFLPQYWNYMHESQRQKAGFMLIGILLHPRTSGTVRLRSDDPFDTPIYDFQYLQHPDDIKDLLQAVRVNQKLADSKALQSLGIKYASPHHPACKEHQFDTDNYWDCYIRYSIFSAYHYASTCRMANDSSGVVDHQLRVKGIKNLRVADASIMPHVTSGNTMTPTIMIGEKAADMIKQTHT